MTRDFAGWVRAHLGMPFLWGTTDCASLVRFGLLELQGRDWWDWSRWYSTAGGALRCHRAANGAAAYLQGCGWVQGRLSAAQRGDVVVIPSTANCGFTGLGLCTSRRRFLSSSVGSGVVLAGLDEAAGGAYMLRGPGR